MKSPSLAMYALQTSMSIEQSENWPVGHTRDLVAFPACLPPDRQSSKARVSYGKALTMLCANHGTIPERALVRVEKNRRVIYVLRIGVPASPVCFLKVLSSTRTKWRSVFIPHGWKVAVYAEKRLWTGEVMIIDNELKYRFTFVNEQGEEQPDASSSWLPRPTSAFKMVLNKVNPTVSQDLLEKVNGNLYIGCHHETVQEKLRACYAPHFYRGNWCGLADISTLMDDWLFGESQLRQQSSPPEHFSMPMSEPDDFHSMVISSTASKVQAQPSLRPLGNDSKNPLKRHWKDDFLELFPQTNDGEDSV